MARNKHPEETIRLIISTAARLFVQKGYDQTSLQDIMDETKLSKGAIYYHFTSKEEIFVRICEEIGRQSGEALAKVRDNPELNGVEKLREIFRDALLSNYRREMAGIVPYLRDHPRFLAMQIEDIFEEVVPYYMEPILKEGISDGSIRAENPKELAEALLMLSNIWLNPMTRPTTPEEAQARCAVYNKLTASAFGAELIDDEMAGVLVEVCERLQARRQQENAEITES